MDLFRASITLHIGQDGWYGYCCGVQSKNHTRQRLNKQRLRQQARQILKRDLYKDLHHAH